MRGTNVQNASYRHCEHPGLPGFSEGVNSCSEGVNSCSEGVVWSNEDAQGPQHRLQTAHQGVHYVPL
eukprot:7594604-Pyramimonas_sp.AAC.2